MTHSAAQIAQAAYGRNRTALQTPREQEASVFESAIAALGRAEREGPRSPAGLKALHENRQMWLILAQDCSLDTNPLPAELRAQIISLAAFVFRYTSDVILKQAEIIPLIEINRTIWAALRGRAGQG